MRKRVETEPENYDAKRREKCVQGLQLSLADVALAISKVVTLRACLAHDSLVPIRAFVLPPTFALALPDLTLLVS